MVGQVGRTGAVGFGDGTTAECKFVKYQPLHVDWGWRRGVVAVRGLDMKAGGHRRAKQGLRLLQGAESGVRRRQVHAQMEAERGP